MNAARRVGRNTVRASLRCAIWAITGALLLAGCRARAPETDVSPEEPLYPQGLFFYEAMAMNQPLKGKIVITDTLVIVEPEDDTCWRPERTVDPALREKDVRVFFCTGVPVGSANAPWGNTRLVINLRHPTLNSRWGRYTPRVDVRHGCLRWARTPSGERTCVQQGAGRQYGAGWEYGPLRVSRGSLLPPDTGASPPRP
ncbi:MAG TPA: hypothetical protein VF178_13545 [Gemmatimonadaceae bacterium]